MWAAIVIIVVALLLVLMAPKPKIENARAANLGDFNFPRSKEGDPLQWFLGRVRIKSPNSLWYGDYNPVPIKKKQKTGLFSSKRVTVGYKYHVGLDLCFGIGGSKPVRLLKLWSDKYVIWQGAVDTETTININLPRLFGGDDERGGLVGAIDYYPGGFDQTRNAYMAAKADPDVPAYVGQCHLVFRGNGTTPGATGFYFGTSTNVNPISAEMERHSSNVSEEFSIMPNGADVNPMEFLHAAFTEKFGMPGMSTDRIDLPSWQRDAETLYNEGMGMSLLVQTGNTGKDIAEEALRIADGILYQDDDTGKMVSRLIRQDYDIEDLPVFDESIVRELTNFSKTTWEQTYNQCRVTFKDRSNEYADKVATAQDFANINFQNRVKNTDISVPGCFEAEEANDLATRQLSLLSVPLFQIEIRCNRRASLMKPGDVFIFEYKPYGISNMVMRIQKIDKGTLIDGVVTINAVQDRFATALAVFAPPGGTGWVNPVGDPQPLPRETLFELPFEMSGDARAVVATLGSRASTVDMGYTILSGVDGGGLTEQGQTTDFTPSGLLTGAYGKDTPARDPTGFSLADVIQLAEVDEEVSEDDLLAGDSVALLTGAHGSELVAFKSFDGVEVTDVIRGIFGTVPLDHPSGTEVYFISAGYGIENPEEAYSELPRDIIAKLLTFNARGMLDEGMADLLELTAIGKSARPAVPGRVRINGDTIPEVEVSGVVGSFGLAWAHRSRLDSSVRTQDEPSVTPEDSTRYNIRAYTAADVLLAEALDANASVATCRFDYTGVLRLELEAVDTNGLTSYSKWVTEFSYDQGSETVSEILPDETTIIFDGGGA